MLSYFQYFKTNNKFLSANLVMRHFVFTDSRNAFSVKMVFTICKRQCCFEQFVRSSVDDGKQHVSKNIWCIAHLCAVS